MNYFRNQESMMDRITNLETHLREMCNNLASYTRKIAKTRDDGDNLANSIFKFAEEENINSSMRYALNNYADYFSAVQDYRNVEVYQLEGRIIQELSVYGELCKKAKEETRKGLLAKAKAGDIIRGSSISELPNAAKTFEINIDRFEQRKLSDLKKFFKELAQIEMYFHAKSIELLTKAYKEMTDVDEKSDLNSFRNYFGLRRAQSPVKDRTKKSKGTTGKIVATSLRRFSSSPEVSSEKNSSTNIGKMGKSDTSESDEDDIDEVDSDVDRSKVTGKSEVTRI